MILQELPVFPAIDALNKGLQIYELIFVINNS
jgi:hypothetical protein